MLINGLPGTTITANDRGLQYGDGVFRTLLLRNGNPVHWERQYQKLQHDASALGITCPAISVLAEDIARLAAAQPDAVIKIILTRGNSSRGYAPPAETSINRIVSAGALPEYPSTLSRDGIKLQICNLRLSHQPRLAGIKHLNRLENVLAAAELTDPYVAEGLLLDQADCVIEGIRSNLFIVRDAKLYTPGLERCGVAGVQRERVLECAATQGIQCSITNIRMPDLLAADEIFIVNSVIGVWPVREMPDFARQQFPVTQKIRTWLNDAIN